MPLVDTCETLSVPSPISNKAFDVREWVSSKVYWRGVDYYKDGRVVAFEIGDDNAISAEVEGSELYRVEIKWSNSGEPETRCTCPYDWEPMCKHAVAAILFWQERDEDAEEKEDQTAEETYFFNRDTYINEIAEIERRKRRSKKIIETLKILRRPKNGLYGEYKVASATTSTSYTVIVRDLEDLSQTTCDCADYLVSELGTCKHIECVHEEISQHPKRSKTKQRGNAHVFISIKPRDTYAGGEVQPFSEIHIHSSDPVIRKRLFVRGEDGDSFWTEDGFMCSVPYGVSYEERFSVVLNAIENRLEGIRAPKVIVADHVKRLVTELEERRIWEIKTAGLLRASKFSSEWMTLKRELPISLYDYQEEGILFAVSKRRTFIGDDMGLGKTVQAIAASLLIKKLADVRKALIFCPASLKFQWKREIEKISSEKAEIVQGNRVARRQIYEKSEAFFLVVNYEMIFRDEEFLQGWGADIIILDEAQRIKNWDTKTAKGIKRLKSPFAIVLTGTPFENRLPELHSLCEFLYPRALGPLWRLLPTYGNLDAHEKLVGFTNLSMLRRRIEPFFLRREKATVMNQLPDKIVNEYAIEISREQCAYHDDYEAKLASILSKAKKRQLTPEEIKRILMCLTAMRIISNALAQHDWEKFQPMIDVPNALSLSDIRGFHSPKLMEFRSIMEDLLDTPEVKFVIFSQWERMLLLAEASVRDLLMKRGLESVIFSGAIPTSARARVIERFINDSKLRIFFSTDAGGVGLNLQEAASYVINLEMPWNPAVLEQRIARVHRIGQRRAVNVINLVSTGCVEERVYATVCNKRKLFDGLFDGQTNDVAFERGSSFIERLKEVIGDVEEKASRARGEELVVDLRSDEEDSSVVGSEIVAESEERIIDLSGIAHVIGSLIGKPRLASILPPESLKIGIRECDGELSLTIKKPPKEFRAKLKNLLTSLAEAIA